ncbi:MAG: hypothetical protein JRJ69_15695 [Deltaproteobacteria bacterium]|nr:hypothetical protein [Deltaproteobacteria bacterium]
MLTRIRKWLEATTGSPKTEKEAKWFLAYWEAEGLNQQKTRELAETIQAYCDNPISYESMEADFFIVREELGEENEEDLILEQVGFYDV